MSDKNGRPLKPDLRGSKQKFQSLTTTAFKSKQSLDQQGKGLAPYPKPGLSSLGKVSARRIPKPHIESKRTENYGEDPDVQLVPKDGAGWGKSAEAGAGSCENGGKKDSFPGNSSFPGGLHPNTSVGNSKLWNDLNTVGSQRPRNYISNDFPTLTSEEKQPAPQESNSSFSLKPNRPSWNKGATGKFDEREETGPETTSSDASRQDPEYAHYPDMKPAFMKSKEQTMMAKASGPSSQHSNPQFRSKKDDEWKSSSNKESKELDKIVELDKDAEGWAGATGEVDYNKKIVFSDEEDGTDSGGSAGRNERRKMYNSGVPGDNMRFRGGANKENFTPKVDRRDDFFRTNKGSSMENKYSTGPRKPENQAPFFQTSNDRNMEKDMMNIGGHPSSHMRSKNNSDHRNNAQMHDMKRRDFQSHGDSRNMRASNDNWQDYDSRGPSYGSHHPQESAPSRSNEYSSNNFPSSSQPNASSRFNPGMPPGGSGHGGPPPGSNHQQGPHNYSNSQQDQIRRRTSSGQDYERKQPPIDDKGLLYRSSNSNNDSSLGKSSKRTSFLEEQQSRYPPMDKSGHQGGLQQQQQSHSTPSDGGNMRCSATDMQQSMNFNSSSSRVGPFNSSNSGGAAPAIGRNRYDSEGSTGSGGKAVDSNRNMQLAFKQQFDPASMMKAHQQAAASAPAPFFFPPPPLPQMMPGPMNQMQQQQFWQQYQMMMAARFPFQPPHPFPMPPPQSLMNPSAAPPVSASNPPITSSSADTSTNVVSNEILTRPPPEGAASIAESPLNSLQSSNNVNNQKWTGKSGSSATQTASMPLSPSALEDAGGLVDNFSQQPLPREEVKTKRVQRSKRVQLTDSSELEGSEKQSEEPTMKILERPSKDKGKDSGKPVSAASFFHAPKQQEEDNSNNDEKQNVMDCGGKKGNDYYGGGNDKKRYNPKSLSLDYESKDSTSSPDDFMNREHGNFNQYGDHHSKQSGKHYQEDNSGFYQREQRQHPDRRLEQTSSYDEDSYGSSYRSAGRRDRDRDRDNRDAPPSYNSRDRGTIGDSSMGHSSGVPSSGGQPQIVREFRRGGRGVNFSRGGSSSYSSNSGGGNSRGREFVSHQRSHHQDYVDEKDEFEDEMPAPVRAPRDTREERPAPVQAPVGSAATGAGATGGSSKKEQSQPEVQDLMSNEIKFDDLSEDNRQKLQHDFLGSGTRRSDINERYGKNFTSYASRGGARNNQNRRSTGDSFDRTSKRDQPEPTKVKENSFGSTYHSKKSPERFRPVEKQNSLSHSDPVSTVSTAESTENSSISNEPPKPMPSSSIINWNSETAASKNLFPNPAPHKEIEPESFASSNEQHAPMQMSPSKLLDSEDGIDAEMTMGKGDNDDDQVANESSKRPGAGSRSTGSKGRGSSTGATWEIKSSSSAARSSTRGTARSRGGSAGLVSGSSSSSKPHRYYDRSTGSAYYDRMGYDYYYYDGYAYPPYSHQGYGSHYRSSGNDYRSMGNASASTGYYTQGQAPSGTNKKPTSRGAKSSSGSVTESSGLKKGSTRDRKKASGRREHSNASRNYDMNDKNYTSNDQGNQEEWETASESSDFDKRDSKNDKVPVAGNETQSTTQLPTSNSKNDQRVGKGNVTKKSFSGQRPGADRGRNLNSNANNTASKPTANSNDAKPKSASKESKHDSSSTSAAAAESAKEKSKERPYTRRVPDISQYDMNRISGIVIIDQNMRPNIASDDDCADDTFQEVVSRRTKAQKAAANKKAITSTPASPSKEKAVSPRVNKGGITKRSSKTSQNANNQKTSKYNSAGSNENKPPSKNNRNVTNTANHNDGMHNIQNFEMVQRQLNRPNMEPDHVINSDPASSGKNSMITTPPPNKVGNAWEKPLQTLILQDSALVPSLPMASTAKDIQNGRAPERRTQMVPDEGSWSMPHSTGNAFMPDATQKVQAAMQQQAVRTSSSVGAPVASAVAGAATGSSGDVGPRQFTSQQYRMQIEAASAAAVVGEGAPRFSTAAVAAASDQRTTNDMSQVKEQPLQQQQQQMAPNAPVSGSGVVSSHQLKRTPVAEQNKAEQQVPPPRLDSANVAPGAPAPINRSLPNDDHPSMSFFTSCAGSTADLNSFLRRFETGVAEEVGASNSSEGNRSQGMSLNESAEDSSMKQQIEDNLRHMFADSKEDEYGDSQSNGAHSGISHHQVQSSGAAAAGATTNTEMNMTAKSHVLACQVTSSASSSLDQSSKVCTVKPQKQAAAATVAFRNISSAGGAVVAAMSGGGPNPVGLNDYHQPTSMDLHNHLNMHSQSQSQNLYFDDHLSNYSYNTQSAAPGGPFFDSTGAFSADVTAAAVLAAQQQVHGSTGPHQPFMGGANQVLQTGQKPQSHAQAIGIPPQTGQNNSVASLGAAGSWTNAAAAAAHNQLFYGDQAAAPQSSHVGTAAAMAQNSSGAAPYQQATAAAFNPHSITNNIGAQAAAAANFNSFSYSPLIGMTRGQQASGHPPTAFMAQAAPPQPNNFGHMINSSTLQPGLSNTTFPSPQHPANPAAFDHLNMGQFGAQTHPHPGGKAMSPQSHNANDFKHDFALSQFSFNDASLFNSVNNSFKDQSPHSHFMSNFAASKNNASQYITGASSFGGPPGPNANNTGAIQQPNAGYAPGGSGSFLNKNMFGAQFSTPKPDSSMIQNAQKQFGFTSIPSALQGGNHFAGGPNQFHKPNSLQLPSNANNAPQSLLQTQPSSALFSGYHGSGSNVTRMPNPIQRPNTMYQRPSPRAAFVANNVFNVGNPAVVAASMNSTQQKVNGANDRSSPNVGTHRPWSSADHLGAAANSMQSKFHQTSFNLQGGNSNGGASYSTDNSMSRIPNSSMVRPRNTYSSPQGISMSTQAPMTRFQAPMQGSAIKRDVNSQGPLNGSMKDEKVDSSGYMQNSSMPSEAGGNSLFVSSEIAPNESSKAAPPTNVNAVVEQKDLSASEMGGQQNIEEGSLTSSGVSAIVNSTGSEAPASGGNSAVVVD